MVTLWASIPLCALLHASRGGVLATAHLGIAGSLAAAVASSDSGGASSACILAFARSHHIRGRRFCIRLVLRFDAPPLLSEDFHHE